MTILKAPNKCERVLIYLVRDAVESVLCVDDVVVPGLLDPEVALVRSPLVVVAAPSAHARGRAEGAGVNGH